MIILLGLAILVAAVVVGVAGVVVNDGGAHPLTDNFAVFGYHVTGSTGTLFLYGIAVGVVGMFGLSLLFAGARRTARRGLLARRELEQSRREAASASRDRDGLAEQQRRESADASTVSGTSPDRSSSGDRAGGRGRLPRFGRRPASRQPTSASPDEGRLVATPAPSTSDGPDAPADHPRTDPPA
jgi:hypothetical protein